MSKFSHYNYSNSTSDSKNQDSELFYKDLDTSKSLLKIERSKLISNNKKDCSYLKNFKIVGSYNWKDDSTPEKPIMVIPGEQGYIFEDQKLEQLNKEEYLYIEDKNLAEFPDYPLEPIYQSILQCTPDYEFENVDVILDRKILRTFLNFVENQEKDARNWKITDGFRLDFQRVGNSIVILNGIQGSKYICNDYAKDFEAKITKGRKVMHKKIASYELGNLKLLVRFDADYGLKRINKDLSALFSAVDLNNNETLVKIENSKLAYVKKGILQDSHKTVEIATKATFYNKRTYQNVFEFPKSKWEALFFTNIKFLMIGWHTRGLVKNIERISYDEVTDRSNRTKKTIHEAISKVTDILTKLRDFALSQDEDNARYSAVFDGDSYNDCVNVYKCNESKEIIPSKLAQRIYCGMKVKKEEVLDEKIKV